jgi:hypothetical protein
MTQGVGLEFKSQDHKKKKKVCRLDVQSVSSKKRQHLSFTIVQNWKAPGCHQRREATEGPRP